MSPWEANGKLEKYQALGLLLMPYYILKGSGEKTVLSKTQTQKFPKLECPRSTSTNPSLSFQ
jgi:hypothetical protein